MYEVLVACKHGINNLFLHTSSSHPFRFHETAQNKYLFFELLQQLHTQKILRTSTLDQCEFLFN